MCCAAGCSQEAVPLVRLPLRQRVRCAGAASRRRDTLECCTRWHSIKRVFGLLAAEEGRGAHINGGKSA